MGEVNNKKTLNSSNNNLENTVAYKNEFTIETNEDSALNG